MEEYIVDENRTEKEILKRITTLKDELENNKNIKQEDKIGIPYMISALRWVINDAWERKS